MGKRKYSDEFKLKIILEYLQGNESLNELAQKYHVVKGDLQKWRDAYECHGVEGILSKDKNNNYSGDFKLLVLEYMHITGSSFRSTAAHFNIPSYSSIAKWERMYCNEGVQSLYEERRGVHSMGTRKSSKKPNKPIDNNESLIEEVKRLRMENEYLKKLNALVQKRESSEKKTK